LISNNIYLERKISWQGPSNEKCCTRAQEAIPYLAALALARLATNLLTSPSTCINNLFDPFNTPDCLLLTFTELLGVVLLISSTSWMTFTARLDIATSSKKKNNCLFVNVPEIVAHPKLPMIVPVTQHD
jgi:hypothetical protein